MSALSNIIDKNSIIHSAYRDNTETLAQIIPYLLQRKMAANKLLNYSFESEVKEQIENSLFEQIQFCNNAISLILGITIE
jgi:hypothetical protein